jgi:hypothetical protein
VARYTEIIAVDKPFPDAWRAVHAVLVAHNWNIVNVRDNTFFVRERLSLETMLWRNPCRFALHVRGQGEERSELHILGSTLGFGPLPKGRLRKVTAALKEQITGALARLADEPAS